MDPILPFLRPIEVLLRDQQMTEVIVVNAGGARVFVERTDGSRLFPRGS